MKRKILALALTILVMVTAVTGCGSGSGQDSKTDDSTVTVLGAIINETFDPFTTARMESWVKFALFDYLFRIDENGEVQPMLAESWEEGEDGLTITIYLRQDVKTHDGLTFNADDVIFSLDTLFASPTNYYLATYMASWEKVDEYTVKVIKGGAYCKTLEVLATNCPMVSMEAYQELGAEGFAAEPVGTGPYTLVEQGGANVVTLQAYQDYWNGVPAYETLEVRPPIDMSTAVISLQNGELDVVASVPAAQWSILEGDDSVVLDTTTGWASMTLCMMNGLSADQNLRRAIYHGVNRQNLIAVATEGTAEEAKDIYSILTMGELSGTFDVPGYDVDLAKEYLAASDYVEGTPIPITVTSDVELASAQSIQNDLNQIGITLEINQVDANNLASMLTNGEVDMYLSATGMISVSTIDMLFYWETDDPIWGPQIAHDPEYDELCAQMRVETDQDKLMELAHRAMEIQYELANQVGIYESLYSVAHSADVAGVDAMQIAATVRYPGDLRPAA